MPPPDYSRILVVQLRHIGDVLLTTPALRALRLAFPEALIHFLVESTSRPVLNDNLRLDGVLVRDRRASLWQGIALLRQVRRNRYDLVVDYQHLLRTGLIALASGARVKLSYGHTLRRYFYTATAPAGLGYMAESKLDLLRHAGVHCASGNEAARPELEVGDAARAHVARYFAEHGLCGQGPVVSIDPMSRKATRRWDGYAELADRIAVACGARVVFLWGPGSRETVEAIVARARLPHLLAPPTDLQQLAALLERCNLHIGNDSAPRHLAVARRTPTLTVVVQTDPETWTFPDRCHRTVRATIATGPDRHDDRGDTLDQLVEHAAALIAAGRDPDPVEVPQARSHRGVRP